MRKLLLLSFVSMLVLAACGGGTTEPTPPAPGDKGPALTGTVSGKITFDGAPPKADKIQMTADPYCATANKEPFAETVKVTDGGLDNVIVYISKGLEGKSFPAPTEPVVIDQHDCHYIPHALTAQVGQKVQIKNSDMTSHNIHVYDGETTLFNKSQSAPMTEDAPASLTAKEMLPAAVRCDVHKWMNANIGVFSHPAHAVTKSGGTFEFKAPPGMYEVTAWHEKYGMQTTMVTVPDNGKVDANFTFKP